MSARPPELEALVDGYRKILSDVDNGVIDINEAYRRLGGLAVTDGTGARWAVSPEHDPDDPVFIRAAVGSPAAPAPPHLFASAAPEPVRQPEPEPVTAAWTDDVEDLLTPPAADPTDSWEDDTAFVPRWEQPNQGFPDDVTVGEPTTSAWDPRPGPRPGPRTDQHPADLPATPTGANYGQVVTGRSGPGMGARASDAAASAVGVFTGMRADRRRTLITVAVCLAVVAAVLFIRGGGKDEPAKGAAFHYKCPKPSVTVAGVTGDQATLLGCLDGVADASSADRGPQMAQIAVERAADGTVTFAAQRQLTQADAIQSAARLYAFAGGPAPQSSATPVDTAGLTQTQAADVQAGVDLGLVSPEGLSLAAPATRGYQALLLYRALTRAGVIDDASSAAMAADAAANDPESGRSVTALREAGIVDGAVEDPFGFADPMLVTDWVMWAGRSSHEIRTPGSMAARIKASTTTTAPGSRSDLPTGSAAGTQAGGPTTPDATRVAEVISAVTSGNPTVVATVVDGPVDGTTGVLNVSVWAGFDDQGLQVHAQAAPATQEGGAVQVWEVGSEGGGAAVEYKVKWKLSPDGVTWILDGWPQR